MPIADEIHARLVAAFQPTVLVVSDESEKHRGHAGYRDGGESHFQVVMTAAALAPLSRLARHRAVHDALGDIILRIHALGLDIRG